MRADLNVNKSAPKRPKQVLIYDKELRYAVLCALVRIAVIVVFRDINMKKLCLIAFLMSGLSFAVQAQQSRVPNHCTANETVFLTAKMKRINQSPQGTTFTDTGKIVSLCADQAKDPIGKLIYRFGPIGKVEMDHVASPSNKLGNASIQSGPRMSEDLYFFSKGNFTYYIIVAGGMGNGVSLLVFNEKKRIVNLFSGTEESRDFQLSHNLDAKAVLTQRKPLHDTFAN